MCACPIADEIATISYDGTIRIWSSVSLMQLYEFAAPRETARCVTFHPHDNVIVCGFDNGFVRVFSVPSTTYAFVWC